MLTSSIAAFLDPDRLKALAEDLGCVSRTRKHHAGLMTIAAILSALRHGPDTEGRWLDAQSLYERLGGRRGGATAFRDKLRDLEPVFRELLRRRVLSLHENNRALRGRLSAFADVLIPDGCAFKIAAALAGIWPGTGTPAEFKLHAVYSARAGSPTCGAAPAASTTTRASARPPGCATRSTSGTWAIRTTTASSTRS